MDIYKTPMLTARETARCLQMPESTLDLWLADTGRDPLVHAVRPEKRGWPRVPFVGIIEAYVLRSLREAGFSMGDIRRASRLVREEFKDPYALAKRRIATDGVKLFVRLADESIVHVRDHQRAFPEVIAESLTYITWSAEGAPERLRLPQYPLDAEVIIDPRFGWGAPVLAESKIPVESVVSLFRAGESIANVAEEFDLKADVVENVVRQAV
ncbi:DUF433 domain-containing protein [Sinomonas sp. G460-2]|uniref:DUF433 domain-containing protein n=1 Tax=Sinomonas sp. G460-2 TaxID=3393464 RepID=UPI0039EFB503